MTVTVARPSISLDCARAVVARALERAHELDKQVAIAVVDESGNLVAFARMDQTPYSTIQIATDKAYSAATTRKSTADWFETIKTDEPLRAGAAIGTNRLIVFGGGQMIEFEGKVIGAIGVSGSHWSNDIDIGTAGIGAIPEFLSRSAG